MYLNGERVEVKNFEQYIKMYQMESTSANTKENKIVYCKAGPRWEIGVGVSDGHLQQVSFVNSICTSKGGKHVDYIAQKLVDYLLPVLKKKTKKDVKPVMIRQYLYIFCNCSIENPAFDSQTKETLTTVSRVGVDGGVEGRALGRCRPVGGLLEEGGEVRDCGVGRLLLALQGGSDAQETERNQNGAKTGHPEAGRRELRRHATEQGLHADHHRG